MGFILNQLRLSIKTLIQVPLQWIRMHGVFYSKWYQFSLYPDYAIEFEMEVQSQSGRSLNTGKLGVCRQRYSVKTKRYMIRFSYKSL